MRILDKKLRAAIREFQSFVYCFIINQLNGEELYLTSSSREVIINNIEFLPDSGLSITEGLFNDSGQNYLMLEGIFEERGVDRKVDLTGASVKVMIYFSDNNFCHLFTYYCRVFSRGDLDFKMRLEPETVKYGKSLLQLYSKTCRANFGDDRCKIDKSRYSKKYRLVAINGNNLKILGLEQEDGYFNYGEVSCMDSNFKAKIIRHRADNVEIVKAVAGILSEPAEIILTAGCDKNFITCCNKFDNAVNFRGEPFVPEYHNLKT